MAEWLVVKTNSRNPPHQIGYGREKQRKNSIGSTTQKQRRGGGMRWENPVTVLQFSFATHFPSSTENPSLNCKTFRSNAPLNPQNPHPSQWRFDLSTIWNRLHFYWPWLWLWNFILLAISIDLREKGGELLNSCRANSAIN